MKKSLVLACVVCMLAAAGCSKHPAEVVRTVEGNWKSYSEMSDGTWQWDGYTYKYRLEISGRMHAAVKDSTFVYLSNIEDISFREAMLASGLSSNTEDYYSPDEAVLVEIYW